MKEGAPIVKRNRIHNGRDSGVLVCENGKGSVVDNDIFANQMAGVAIGRGVLRVETAAAAMIAAVRSHAGPGG